MKVFLSFSNESIEFAQKLTHDLESQGISVWFSPRDLRAGEDITVSITKAIQQSQIFIPILSVKNQASVYQTSEIALVLSLKNEGNYITIIPVITDKKADIPIFLKRTKYIDFSNKEDYNTNLKTLVNAIENSESIQQLQLDVIVQDPNKYLEAEKTALHEEILADERKRYKKMKQLTNQFAIIFSILALGLSIIAFIRGVSSQSDQVLIYLVIFVFVFFGSFSLIMWKRK